MPVNFVPIPLTQNTIGTNGIGTKRPHRTNVLGTNGSVAKNGTNGAGTNIDIFYQGQAAVISFFG